MSEWLVVTVIGTLLGLVVTVVTPILKLNTTLTKLAAYIDRHEADYQKLCEDNAESHRRIWKHNEEQDQLLAQHELRLHDLDGK
jgi:hypothetical protein